MVFTTSNHIFPSDRRQSYDQDKRDIWTLQRVLAEESKAKKTSKSKKASDRDSGRGSIGSGPMVLRQISKLSSGFLRGTQQLRPAPKTQTLSGPVNLGISGIRHQCVSVL